jgi:hypothetical protein
VAVNARLLTHATNALLIVAAGMIAGHLLMPARSDATVARRAGFVLTLAMSGALAGWRECRSLAAERGRSPLREALWAPAGGMLALLAGAIAWLVVHG